MRIKHKN